MNQKPPSTLELHWWWLTRGQPTLRELLNKNVRDCESLSAISTKQIQNILDEFACNSDVRDDLLDTLPAIRERFDYPDMSTPSVNLSTVRCHIFRREALGAIQYNRVPEGLSLIDKAEEYREQMVKSALDNLQEDASLAPRLAVVVELNNASRLHYLQCYIAFRIHVCYPIPRFVLVLI